MLICCWQFPFILDTDKRCCCRFNFSSRSNMIFFLFTSDFLHAVFFVPGDKFAFPFIPFVCRVCHLEHTEKQWTVF